MQAVDLITRPAVEADRELVSQLYGRYMAELAAMQNDVLPTPEWFAEAFDHVLLGQRELWLGLEQDDVVGFALFRSSLRSPLGTPERYGEVSDFYVLPEFRRRGIGRQLARRIFDRMREQGSQVLWLDVLRENHHALQFWESLGLHVRHFSLTGEL